MSQSNINKYTKRNRLRKIDAKSLSISIDLINSKVFLYEDGILIGESEFEINKKNKDMNISDFNILTPYRDKGYGNYLARNIIILARLFHLKTLLLIDGSTLEGFWQRLGFKWSRGRSYWVLKL